MQNLDPGGGRVNQFPGRDRLSWNLRLQVRRWHAGDADRDADLWHHIRRLGDADCSGTASTCMLTMDTDKTALAKFHLMSGPPGT